MKRIFILAFLLINTAWAEPSGPILRVAVTYYDPPFVFSAGGNEFFGFDITIVNHICIQLNRPCKYSAMTNKELIEAVGSNKVDIAVSSLTINPAEAGYINFSIPYLNSKSRFLARAELSEKKFDLNVINGARIGIETDTIFRKQLDQLGLQNVTVISFPQQADMIDSLSKGEIDLALLDSETSIYWANDSAGILKTFGPSLPYGPGYGVAVNGKQTALLNDINSILQQFLVSDEFKNNYTIYIHH